MEDRQRQKRSIHAHPQITYRGSRTRTKGKNDMHMRGVVCALAGTAILCGALPRVEARSLSQQIDSLFGEGGITLDVDAKKPGGTSHRAHFSSSSLATFGLFVKQLAPNAADFPAISTVPGFTYRYNPDILSFERSSASLGPVFIERPQTLGQGKFDIGMSYLFVDFEELNGKDLDRLKFRLTHNDCCNEKNPPPSPGIPVFENDTADIFFEKFALRSHVVSFFATYGITDRWDVNILLPVVFTSLQLRARAVLNNESGEGEHFFDAANRIAETTRSVDDDATGVGDLQIRTKYRLFSGESFNLASGLALRLPTGKRNDFQGLEDTTLMPMLAAAFEWGRFDVHGSSGIEFNFDDSDRSRERYAAGVTLRILEQVALLADVIGNSNLKTDRIGVTVPQFVSLRGRIDEPPSQAGVDLPDFRRFNRKLSTDIIDLNVGFKTNPFGSVVGFATVFIPLTDDGLRADAIPAVGLEMSF
jgi:hypothetical protein